MYRIGSVQKKIMLALLGGVALGLSSNPRQYFKTLGKIGKEWKAIDRRSLNRSMRRLSNEKLVERKLLSDGSFKLMLTAIGKREASRLNLLGSSIDFKKKKKWDGKWRIVIFDIPEKDRNFRDILREHLRELGFFKLQQSVFVSPHPFEKMIIELTYLYSAELYVRIITADAIDNDRVLKRHFAKVIKT